MRKAILAILIFILSVIQVSLFSNLFPGRIAPDIALLFIILWSARNNLKPIWPWAVTAGLFLDILTFNPLGVNAVSFLIVSFGVSNLARRFTASSKFLIVLWYAGFIVLGTMANFVIVNTLGELIRYWREQNFLIQGIIRPSSLMLKMLFNLIIFLLIYAATKMFKITSRVRI